MPVLASTVCCGLQGVNGFLVNVEAYLSNGLVSFDVVGLPSAALKESKERVRAAVTMSGYRMPVRKIVVNLSPADLKKEGTGYELAIAVALLAAEEPEGFHGLRDTLLLGELSLQGAVLPVRGVLPMVISAYEQGLRRVLLPADNAGEVACLDGLEVYPVRTLREACMHLTGEAKLSPQRQTDYQSMPVAPDPEHDLAQVRGQALARRALEVAAAGGHNLLMMGVPGCGKTMLAQCLPGILPPMTLEEALETTRIHSAAGVLNPGSGLMTAQPFRSPHHNASMPAVIGGGSRALPGEVSLAHNGVLFLDELPEFERGTLEALRQPLEDGFVNIARANWQGRYQARCMLVASMNPCPCGNYGSETAECHCSPVAIRRYRSKISGPLLDRIDLQVEMDAVKPEEITLRPSNPPESSEAVRRRVAEARQRQRERYRGTDIRCNAHLSQEGVTRYCQLTASARTLLQQAMERFHLSMRAYGRIQKVALSMADLAGRERIEDGDVAQAIQYRGLDGRGEE